MENWIKWVPHPEITNKICITEVSFTSKNYFIYGEIEIENLIKFVKFDYEDSVLGITDSDEGSRIKTARYLARKYGKTILAECKFFKIENSSLVKDFLESGNLHQLNTRIEHHVFFDNSVIDILCIKGPKITISNEEIL